MWFEGEDKEGNVACLKGTPGAELVIQPHENDIVIEKERISAYDNTGLSEIIREKGIRTMFVGGAKSNRCVDMVVKRMYDAEPDLHVVVLRDCVASDNLAQHEAAIREFEEFYPPVITSDQLIADWASRQAA